MFALCARCQKLKLAAGDYGVKKLAEVPRLVIEGDLRDESEAELLYRRLRVEPREARQPLHECCGAAHQVEICL